MLRVRASLGMSLGSRCVLQREVEWIRMPLEKKRGFAKWNGHFDGERSIGRSVRVRR